MQGGIVYAYRDAETDGWRDQSGRGHRAPATNSAIAAREIMGMREDGGEARNMDKHPPFH
jgi:hypothetical protein